MIIDTKLRYLSHLTLGKRLYLISILLAIAVISVSAIAWQALSNQSQAARSVLLLSQAKSLQQDSDMLHDALKSDVYRLLLLEYSRDDKEEMKRLQEASSDLVLTLSSKIEYLQHKLKSVSSHVHQTSSQQPMIDKVVYDGSKVKQDLVINFDGNVS